MRNLILFFIFAILTQFAVADVGLVGRSTTLDGTGTLQAGSLEKFYINVKNGSGGSLADGTVVVLDTSNDDGYTVTTSSTAGAIPHCIIAKVDASACASAKMCRCQTYGLNAGVLFDSTNSAGTAGQSAYISENNAGYVQATAFASVVATDIPVGTFYDSPSASADVELFIKLR